MYRTLAVAMTVGIAAGVCAGVAAEENAGTSDGPVYLVRQKDFEGAVTYAVMTLEEYKALSEEVDKANRALPYAYDRLRDAWEEEEEEALQEARKRGDRDRRRKRFPFKRPDPREARQLGSYRDGAAALERKTYYEEVEAKRAERAQRDEERKLARMSENRLATYQAEASEAAALFGDFQKVLEEVLWDIQLGLDPRTGDAEGGGSGGRTIGVRNVKRLGDSLTRGLERQKR